MSPDTHPEIHRRLDSLENNLSSSLNKLTQAVEKLVALETEHHATRETLSRYGTKLDAHDTRIDTIEKKIPMYDLGMRIMNRIGMIVGTVIVGGIVSSYFVFS